MFREFLDNARSFRRTYRQYLLFESVYLLLTSLAFVPFLAWVFDRILRATGSRYLLNSDVLQFAMDYRGLAGFVLIGILLVLIIFLEFGVIILIAQKTYFNKSISIFEALITTICRIPKIIGVGFVYLFLILVMMSPFIKSPTTDFLLKSTNLDILLGEEIRRAWPILVLFIVLALAVLYLMMRLSFVMHFIVLEKMSSRRAVPASWRLTQNHQGRLLLTLMVPNILLIGVAWGLLTALNYLPQWLNVANNNSIIENGVMILSSYLVFMLTMLMVPTNMILLTGLYYRSLEQIGEFIDDDTVLCHNRLLARTERSLTDLLHRHKNWMRALLLFLLAGTFIMNNNVYSQMVFARWHVSIAAHRGLLAEAPENTIPAFLAAIEQSVDYIELDIQLSSDDVPVVFHDATLKRFTGQTKQISELTLAQLKEIDMGRGAGEEYAGTAMPTLEEVILAVQDNSRLLIDLKPYVRPEVLAAKVIALLEQYDLSETCLIQSFSQAALQSVRTLAPEIRIGQILTVAAGNLDRLDVDFYTIRQTMLSDAFVRSARRSNRQIWVWTVNTERNIKIVLSYDVDGIITDYPERVRAAGGIELPVIEELLPEQPSQQAADTDPFRSMLRF